MGKIKLTMTQALVKYLTCQFIETDKGEVPLFAGIFAIFGHGNVCGLGEALYEHRDKLPTFRGHNEQSMAHTAIAYAKSLNRTQMMACSSSIGPGASNMLTAAALAHVNRLPVLFLPGDIFNSSAPDPVLQQVESFSDGSVSVNDCFKTVSRFYDRITHPGRLISSLPRTIATLTDPANCGPVTLSLPQDTQAEAYDYPESFFEKKVIRIRRQQPDATELKKAADLIKKAGKVSIVAGGGVLYSRATEELKAFADKHHIPVSETQAGKSSLPWDHRFQMGAVGVTGAPSANDIVSRSEVVLAIGSRLQDFTTGSNTIFTNSRVIGINVNPFDAVKSDGISLVGDAALSINMLSELLGDWKTDSAWSNEAAQQADSWRKRVTEIFNDGAEGRLPYDGDVIGAVQSSSASSDKDDIVVCAAGTLPAELHKLWRAGVPNAYHVEYGFSCMGYEIAGGIGVKMAHPGKEVIVMVGDGSYMMLNSEIATSVMMKQKMIIVVQDNRGFGCINRLQLASGSESNNNLIQHCTGYEEGYGWIDFAAHAASMGAASEHVSSMSAFSEAMEKARKSDRTYVIVIDTDPYKTTEEGGYWWEFGVPEVSSRPQVVAAHKDYISNKSGKQRPN